MKFIYYFYAVLFGRPSLIKLNQFLYSLALRGMGISNYQNSYLSGELWFIRNILKSAGDNLIIFDVGANIGSYTNEILNAKVSVKKIYAFEPHNITFLKLLKNVKKKPVLAVNLGLSDQNGIATLYDRDNASGSSHASLSMAIFSEIHRVETESSQIELTTVDDFCNSHQIECIDLLKIDVEGFEVNVLRGAERMLSTGRVRLIQFEFTQLNTTVRVFFKDLYDILSNNYNIYRLLPNGIERIKTYNPTLHEIFAYQNFVCISKK